MDGSDDRLMQIGEVAELAGMSLNTLRHYDEVDLLTPSARSGGGFRLYTEGDLGRLMVIRRMKPLGFTVEEMREVMDLVRALPDADPAFGEALGQRLRHYLELARERRGGLLARLGMADEFIGILHERIARPASWGSGR